MSSVVSSIDKLERDRLRRFAHRLGHDWYRLAAAYDLSRDDIVSNVGQGRCDNDYSDELMDRLVLGRTPMREIAEHLVRLHLTALVSTEYGFDEAWRGRNTRTIPTTTNHQPAPAPVPASVIQHARKSDKELFAGTITGLKPIQHIFLADALGARWRAVAAHLKIEPNRIVNSLYMGSTTEDQAREFIEVLSQRMTKIDDFQVAAICAGAGDVLTAKNGFGEAV